MNAILNYKSYDRLPTVHFGYWLETLGRWAQEGHISEDSAENWEDGNECDNAVSGKLGFDFNWWGSVVKPETDLYPKFDRKILEEFHDGKMKVLNEEGVIVLEKKNVITIPMEIDHLLKNREDWERGFKHRFQFSEERIPDIDIPALEKRTDPLGLFCGSLFGRMRNILGLQNLSYLYIDDYDLYVEIIDTIGNLDYKITETVLSRYDRFDFAHFWEDICFNYGPLVNPSIFRKLVGPHYKKITDLLHDHGIDIVSLDCDGMIDDLLPVWLKNGVNTMFPIEVGTWNASIKPWREQYGRELKGVGGMDKRVFSLELSAVDQEIERLKPLVDLGGYIPCPDHRISPDAKWDNVRYYCDRFRKEFG